jgi:DNA-binding HxlR family transcriptional regulator
MTHFEVRQLPERKHCGMVSITREAGQERAGLDTVAARMPGGPDAECDTESYNLTRELMGQVADRWTLLVVAALSEGPQRFSSIQTLVTGVSHRMLSKTLRGLLRDGMVTRTAYAEVPPRVEYELTELGWTLRDLARGFAAWTESYGPRVLANRERFDRDGA